MSAPAVIELVGGAVDGQRFTVPDGQLPTCWQVRRPRDHSADLAAALSGAALTWRDLAPPEPYTFLLVYDVYGLPRMTDDGAYLYRLAGS